MTIAEILKKQGFSEEQIKNVLDDMKANKVFTASEENLDVRYGKLKADHEGKAQELNEANNLIEELKKSTIGQEELQSRIAQYEAQVNALNAELARTKIDSAVKVELLSAKAADVDYLTYKLHEKLKADQKELTLDDAGTIVGWKDHLSALKTQFPNMFQSADTNNGLQVLDENYLKQNDGKETVTTKDGFRAMSYEQRVALKKQNEQLYKQLAK